MKKRIGSDNSRKAIYALIVGMTLIIFAFIMYNIGGIFDALGAFFLIISPFIWGVAIAYLLNGLVNICEKRVFAFLGKKKPRESLINSLSVVTAVVLFVATIVGLVWIIIPNLITSFALLVTSLPDYLASFQETLVGIEQSMNIELNFLKDLNMSSGELVGELESWIVTESASLADTSISLVTSVAGGISNAFISLIVAIYLLFSRKYFINGSKKLIYAIFPRKHATNILRGCRHTNKVFSKFIVGKLFEALIVFLMTFVIMVIVMPANPYNLLISVLMGVFNIIPFFGPFIGAIPSLLILLVYNPSYALWFLIIVLVTQQIDGQFIGPKILGGSTGLMPFWVIFAIIVGGGLFGILGMILGIPVFAVIYTIITQLVDNSLKKKGLSTNEDDYANPIDETDHVVTKQKKSDAAQDRDIGDVLHDSFNKTAEYMHGKVTREEGIAHGSSQHVGEFEAKSSARKSDEPQNSEKTDTNLDK